MKKVVAVIPVYGRLPLLKHTIKRLLEKNRVAHVVCVGETAEEKETVVSSGGIFVKHANQPLGKKWNAGFEFAKTLKPFAVLFVGSSDWLSSNWLPEMMPLMNKFDLIGKADFTMMDISETVRMCHWDGYGRGPRQKEPIGIGRLVSARVLNKMDWRPFLDNKTNSMDFMMFNKIADLGGQIGLVKGEGLVALSISTNRWPNMHKFEDHWNDKVPSRSHRVNNMTCYFEMFPEYNKIFTIEKKTT